MEKYRRNLTELFKSESTAPITNSSPAHAIILLSTIFHFAHESVNVFCGNLRNDVFGNEDLISEIRCAAYRNVKMVFILEHDNATPQIAELSEKFKSNMEIRIIPQGVKRPAHFVVSDNKAFRIEENHDITKAIGCANFPDIAMLLNKSFASLYKQSRSV